MTTITIVDESMLGAKRVWSLDFLDETITVRELIKRRIYEEVAEYNAKMLGLFQGLVQPTDAERTLNGFRLKTMHRLDWEAQYEQAIVAFSKHSYIVLVDDKQVNDLDTTFTLRSNSEVTFLKLIALIGG